MRTYPRNSPQAAARIVALAALADGHFSRSELGALDRLGAAAQLGLTHAEFQQVIQHLSEDLMVTAYVHWGTACQIDPPIVESLTAEISDLTLRRVTLKLCMEVMNADFHVADAEENLMAIVAGQWRLATAAAPAH